MQTTSLVPQGFPRSGEVNLTGSHITGQKPWPSTHLRSYSGGWGWGFWEDHHHPLIREGTRLLREALWAG